MLISNNFYKLGCHCNSLTMFKRELHIPSHISEQVKKQLLNISCNPYEYNNNLSKAVFKATHVLARTLPPQVISEILKVKNTNVGFLELTGIPTDPNLMQTPQELKDISNKKTFIPELFSLGVAGLLKKELYNFRQEGWGTGNLIFNIFPKPQLIHLKGAGGVDKDFEFHMENAWHTQTPDMLFLKGIRQDHDKVAITYAVANEKLIKALSNEDRNLLEEPCFVLEPPEIHRKMEKDKNIIFSEDTAYVGPVIVKEKNGHKFLVNFNGMRASRVDSVHQTALDRLKILTHELAMEFKLKEDNLLVINNRRALHTRNSYVPKFDGFDRWFQRYYFIDASKLWRELTIRKEDFSFLSEDLAQDLIHELENQGILKHRQLTAKFKPHESNFRLLLPSSLAIHELQIMKILLRKGPSNPNRII